MGDPPNVMLRAMFLALVVVGGVFACRQLNPHSRFEADGSDADWDAAVRQSRDRARPAVVLYTADWCPACQALHGGALADRAVWAELNDRHTFVRVDLTHPTPAARAHAAAAGVHAYPTLIRYDRDGRESARAHAMGTDQLLAWLQE